MKIGMFRSGNKGFEVRVGKDKVIIIVYEIGKHEDYLYRWKPIYNFSVPRKEFENELLLLVKKLDRQYPHKPSKLSKHAIKKRL